MLLCPQEQQRQQLSIRDFLTTEELKIKRALWRHFIEVEARGQRIQLNRVRLCHSSPATLPVFYWGV